MRYMSKMRLLSLTLPLLMTACAVPSTPLPPVRVVDACPAIQPQPEELKTVRSTNSRQQGENLLTEFFSSLPTATK